jgi:hypothetical protein
VSEPLTGRQQRVLGALVLGASPDNAGSAGRVSRRTVYRWLADPAFKAALTEARRQALQTATARLAGITGRAVDALAALLDGGADPQTRCRAALGVLHMAVKSAEVDDLLARVEELESRARPMRGLTLLPPRAS